MSGIREFINSPKGRVVAGSVVAVVLAVALWSILSGLGGTAAAVESTRATYICSETLKPFSLTLRAGMDWPVKSPHSGRMTGYPAELCFWTADGKVKDQPTSVLHNATIGKPGPTFCPDCDRLVRQRNPRPSEGEAPPPTRAEVARGASRETE